jgi:hypothetical protein
VAGIAETTDARVSSAGVVIVMEQHSVHVAVVSIVDLVPNLVAHVIHAIVVTATEQHSALVEGVSIAAGIAEVTIVSASNVGAANVMV